MKTANTLGFFTLLAAAFLSACGCPCSTQTTPPRVDDPKSPVPPAHVTETPPLPPTPPSPAFDRVTDANGITRIYTQTFDAIPPGPEWSDPTPSRTAEGNRPFLGPIVNNQHLTLALANLPDHQRVRISFDLFILDTWDGSAIGWGYGQWFMDLDRGPNLVHTSFSNCGIFSDNNEQAYPDTYPGRPHPAWTAATEKNTLGIPWRGIDASSVYHLVITLPHDQPAITFDFHSDILHDNKLQQRKKAFGLANLQVETLPDLAKPTDRELAALWKDLGHSHYTHFDKAKWELISAGDLAAKYIAQHIAEKIDLTERKIDGLLEDLAAADEEHASELIDNLILQGRLAAPAVDKALEDRTLSRDHRRQLQFIKDRITRYPETATENRLFRAKHLLGIINTPAAKAIAAQIPELPAAQRDTPQAPDSTP